MEQLIKTTRGDFKFQYNEVLNAVDALTCALKENTDSIGADIFVLPTITEDIAKTRSLVQSRIRLKFNDEDQQALLDAPFDVIHQTGNEAIRKTITHIGKFRAQHNESTRYSIKLPGLINIQCDFAYMQRLATLFDSLNAEKVKLKGVIHRLAKSVDQRFEIVHDAEPGLIFPMATRTHPVFIQKDILSARFSWEHKSQIKTLTKQQVIEKIDRSLAYAPNHGNSTDSQAGFELHIQEERKLISHFTSNTLFNITRKAPATPILKLRFNEPKNPNNSGTEMTLRKDLHAHSPVFLINCVDTFKFKPLGDYAGRKEVVSKVEPLIPRLHIYLKEKNQQ